jgi:hypothetical protein
MIPTWKAVDPCPHTHNHMPNSPQCNECRNIDLGWNYDLAIYVKKAPAQLVIEIIPFEAGPDDSHWDAKIEAITQDADPIRMAG